MDSLDERPLWHLTEPSSAGTTPRRSLYSNTTSPSHIRSPFDPHTSPHSPTLAHMDTSYYAGPSRSPSPSSGRKASVVRSLAQRRCANSPPTPLILEHTDTDLLLVSSSPLPSPDSDDSPSRPRALEYLRNSAERRKHKQVSVSVTRVSLAKGYVTWDELNCGAVMRYAPQMRPNQAVRINSSHDSLGGQRFSPFKQETLAFRPLRAM
jgi:hypothetical protein